MAQAATRPRVRRAIPWLPSLDTSDSDGSGRGYRQRECASTSRSARRGREALSEKPTASPQRSSETRSRDLEIHRRCFSAVLFHLILDLLPLVERAQSSTFDCRDVDKHVSAAALRLNKSIALSRIEPFHRAARHCRSPN